jgi:hypothetical protein
MNAIVISISLVCLLTVSAVCYLINFFNNEDDPMDLILDDDETNG